MKKRRQHSLDEGAGDEAKTLTVTWMNRRGAGCVRYVAPQDLERFISTLRRPATVRTETGAVVGKVERTDALLDDRRIKWQWWFDRDVLK